ncbi:relaxase/mobilization nuclease domain-containing protein [Pontibacter actiniarum]|uniref:MobA/VirD2-like nuclease domain-containing protein n=1 Tax=Pontibacter actiniarum TaxID=323450 RepID=A0A1X9YYN6_9BACT|nr:relaxase/mobilization nuclease domain-containing protein [Pontibacter actiniarum]ARS38025.1 hypothetical protein CA264_20960 [Pontibacter actiniarum]
MIVKILSAAAGFNGVVYNEEKRAQGAAQLLKAENFGFLNLAAGSLKQEDYIRYMTLVANTNESVLKSQFHAIISCKGREKSAEELLEIAEEYLQRMGYHDNPYLIYFHSDTAHNHVHMVSTRVSKEGKKVNDKYENVRSQKVMQEILMQDVAYEVKAYLRKTLAYGFSSEAQFKLLLEREGVKVTEKEGQYQFIKYGSMVHAFARKEVADRIAKYKAPNARVGQLKAIFRKYKRGLTVEQFSGLLKEKFGIELVVHQAKGKSTPYGYTILDHASKQVLKGSQVMKLDELLSSVNREDKIQAGRELIAKLSADRGLCYTGFKRQLEATGLLINKKGEIRIKGDEEGSIPVLMLDKARVRELLYQERLQEARQYTVASDKDIKLLSRLFFVKQSDLSVAKASDPLEKEVVAAKLHSGLASGRPLQEILDSCGWSIAQADGKHFLIDYQQKRVYAWADLTKEKPDLHAVQVAEFDKGSDMAREERLQDAWGQYSGTIGQLAASMLYLMESNLEPDQSENRKRKNQRKR